MIETKPWCFIKLGRHVSHSERIIFLLFFGSKVKVTIYKYGNKLVNTIETQPLCASTSNSADILTMVRGLTLLILEVRIGIIDKCGVHGDATLSVVIF